MKIEFLKPAQIELDDAFDYYESQLLDLGYRFQSEIRLSLSRIISYPKSYQKIGKYSRRCLVQKFPYSIIFQYIENKQMIVVVAIAHLHRRPDYWLSREE